MVESRQPLRAMTDDALATALRDLGASLAAPSAGAAGGPDLAARVRQRVEAMPAPGARRWPWLNRGSGRPLRRGLVLALAALLVLAAIAGAVGLGVPGIRIFFGERPSVAPTASPSSLAPLGANLGLGVAAALPEIERLAGFDLLLPTDPDVGAPDAAYVSGGRAALVWKAGPTLPPTMQRDIGLLISEFHGLVESGYYNKVLDSGTKVTPVRVDGSAGYWISGDPHFFYFVDSAGNFINDTHRVVGDTLIWSTGELTFRLESSLSMEAAIRLAESLE